MQLFQKNLLFVNIFIYMFLYTCFTLSSIDWFWQLFAVTGISSGKIYASILKWSTLSVLWNNYVEVCIWTWSCLHHCFLYDVCIFFNYVTCRYFRFIQPKGDNCKNIFCLNICFINNIYVFLVGCEIALFKISTIIIKQYSPHESQIKKN